MTAEKTDSAPFELRPLTEPTTALIAQAIGGMPWQPYPGLWVVVIKRHDGALVLLDSDGVREFESLEEFDEGFEVASITWS